MPSSICFREVFIIFLSIFLDPASELILIDIFLEQFHHHPHLTSRDTPTLSSTAVPIETKNFLLKSPPTAIDQRPTANRLIPRRA